MTIYGAIAAAIGRKIAAFVAETRKLVAEATAVEKKLVRNAKNEVYYILAKAEADEKAVVGRVKSEVSVLKSDLIDKIAKI